MTRCLRPLHRAVLVVIFSCAAQAQHASYPIKPTGGDAAWAKMYATRCGPATRRCPPSTNGYENAFNGDPRLSTLLKSSFPQHQWFRSDHHKLTPLPDLIQMFIGVPGGLSLDEDRYVTADGCVPHLCDVNRGMLWIDTGVHPADAIFVATNLVSGDGSQDASHLWIFSSNKLNWQHLPPSFLISLPRWLSTIAKPGYYGTSGYPFNFVLATIVQPNGEMEDITPETLHLRSIEPGAKQ